MSRRYIILSLLLILPLYSCATKQSVTFKDLSSYKADDSISSIDNETIQSIIKINKHYQFYAGKASIEFYDGNELHRISTLLKMNSSKNIVIKFLGIFNVVVGTLTYTDNSVKFVTNRGSNIDIERIFDDYDIPEILSFLDTINTTPLNTDYSFIDTDKVRVLFGDNITVTTNKETYMVETFSNGKYLVIYDKVDDGKIENIIINNMNANVYIAIKFLNLTNWRSEG